MTKFSLVVRSDASTANRFSTPYTLFFMYYTVSLFTILEQLSQKIKLRVSGPVVSTSLITTLTLTSWALIAHRVSQYEKRFFPNSGRAWLMNIFEFAGIYLLATLIFILVCLVLQKHGYLKN
ncbi:hypothetical protein GQR36_14350 [Enterococcus termitis]